MSIRAQISDFKPINEKVCLYFCAAMIPTATELAAAQRLRYKYGTVTVMNGGAFAISEPEFGTQGDTSGDELMPADAIAGTTIPSDYTTAIANYPDGNVTQGAPANPEALSILPGAAVSFSHTGTFQLYAVAADISEGNDSVTMTDETAIGATGVWSSGTTGTATIGASTGLVTGVAAGTSLITFTLTRASGTAVTATKTITCT